jgi:CarD family transcriptional regulator
MAQKSKAPAKARTSKAPPSAKAARPTSTVKGASAVKTSVKSAAKPAVVSPTQSKKPGAAKAAGAKTVVKTAVKGLEMKKATVSSNAKKPTLKAVVPPSRTAPAAKVAAAAPKKAAAAPVAASRPTAGAPRPAVTPARAAAALSKSGGQKLTAPVQPASPKDIAEKTAAAARVMAAQNAQKKSVSQRHGFKTNEFIVYPAHGVGRIVGIEEQEIAGMSLELFVITFDKEKLTLRVPTGKLESVGMRKLADDGIVKKAMETLKGRARVKRTMWSRRAQEYVAKINSGDLISIAEVVRDLYRSEAQPEQSYSERQLYEDALDRMARELAAVEKLDERGAVQRITEVLSKSARGRRLAEGADAEVKAA